MPRSETTLTLSQEELDLLRCAVDGLLDQLDNAALPETPLGRFADDWLYRATVYLRNKLAGEVQ